MVRGFYTAASGIVTQEKKLNNVASNISNARTVGYKKDQVVMGTFGEHLSIRRNAYNRMNFNNVGQSVYMQVVDNKYTNYAQGGFEATSRPLDMSIMGPGFFVVNTPEGEQLLSRDGQFSLDEEGYLILPGFGRVQGEGGDIEVGTSSVTVDDTGGVYIQDDSGEIEEIDRLMIAVPEDYAALKKTRNTMYLAENYTQVDFESVEEGQELPVVRQYQLERSNVELSDEMTNMIASQRSLQSCSQIVKMYDEMSDAMNTRVSRVQ